jgi:hypothetical protein
VDTLENVKRFLARLMQIYRYPWKNNVDNLRITGIKVRIN